MASRLGSLRAFKSWRVEDEVITDNPFSKISVTVPDDTQPLATDIQVGAMLGRARRGRNPKRDTALFSILIDTGCRKGEVAAMEVRDIDLGSGTVT